MPRQGLVVAENFSTSLTGAVLGVPSRLLMGQKSFLTVCEFSSTTIAGERHDFYLLLLLLLLLTCCSRILLLAASLLLIHLL